MLSRLTRLCIEARRATFCLALVRHEHAAKRTKLLATPNCNRPLSGRPRFPLSLSSLIGPFIITLLFTWRQPLPPPADCLPSPPPFTSIRIDTPPTSPFTSIRIGTPPYPQWVFHAYIQSHFFDGSSSRSTAHVPLAQPWPRRRKRFRHLMHLMTKSSKSSEQCDRIIVTNETHPS